MSLLFIRIVCLLLLCLSPVRTEGWFSRFLNRIFSPHSIGEKVATTTTPTTTKAPSPTLPTVEWFPAPVATCEVNIRNGTPATKDPIYLDMTGNLWVPGPKLLWYANQVSLAVCPGRKNEITMNNKQEARLSCKRGTIFQIDDLKDPTYDFAEVQCKANVSPEVKSTSRACEGGTLFEIGFETSFGFKPLIMSCYDVPVGNVRYTDHVVFGSAIANAVVEKNRQTFKSAGTAKDISPRTHYTKEAQVVRFTRLLGSKARAEQLITATNYLARGHLMPDGDGVFRSFQYATYFYINVVPMWQSINNGNWRIIENKVRDYGAELKRNLYVRTGAIDVMTMDNARGGLVNLTLQAGAIEVPKWIYKLIRTNPYSGDGFVFYALNNPFATTNDRRWCDETTNMCSGVVGKKTRSRWYHEDFKNFAKGFVVCCEVTNHQRFLSFK